MTARTKKTRNISALFDQALTLEDSTGREWVMQPPNKQRGLEQAVLYAGLSHQNKSGGPCKACGNQNLDGLDPKTRAAYDNLQDREFEEIVLGQKIYGEMIEADLSASEMYWLATYTMWFWVLGEATADMMAATYAQSLHGVNPDGTEMDEETKAVMDPKGPATRRPSKSGHSTE